MGKGQGQQAAHVRGKRAKREGGKRFLHLAEQRSGSSEFPLWSSNSPLSFSVSCSSAPEDSNSDFLLSSQFTACCSCLFYHFLFFFFGWSSSLLMHPEVLFSPVPAPTVPHEGRQKTQEKWIASYLNSNTQPCTCSSVQETNSRLSSHYLCLF